MRRSEKMPLLQKLYVVEATKGLFVTCRHFITNLVKVLAKMLGLRRAAPVATYEYPDEIRSYPPRYRGRHRLTLYDDGRVKCTACYLCATACPAKCIYIEAAEHPDSQIEKYPGRYEIDTLLCVYCGFCVEACPVDAIRMDSGIHPEVYSGDPRDYIEDKETLMQRSRDLDEKGPDLLRQMHLEKMRGIEKNPFAK